MQLPPGTVTTHEAGRRLGIPSRDIYRLIDEGHLPLAIDDQGLTAVPLEALERYQESLAG